MTDYKFYKIECLNDDVELCYVGTTKNFNLRMKHHKSCSKNPKEGSYHLNLYKTIRENGGWENFKMTVIGEATQVSYMEARVIEEKYRQELKANLNMVACFTSQEQHKERKKQYYHNNKESVTAQQLIYREKNKELIKERQQRYSVKMFCECGVEMRKDAIYRHVKTKKHINFMKNLTINI